MISDPLWLFEIPWYMPIIYWGIALIISFIISIFIVRITNIYYRYLMMIIPTCMLLLAIIGLVLGLFTFIQCEICLVVCLIVSGIFLGIEYRKQKKEVNFK